MQKAQRLRQPSWIFRNARVRSASSSAEAALPSRRHREEGGRPRPSARAILAVEQTRVARVEERREVAARGEGDDEIHLAHGGEGVRRPLGETARDDERRARALAAEPADGTPAVAQRPRRHRAAVDDEDVGLRRGGRPREGRCGRARVHAAHLAPERLREEPADAGIR